MFREGGKGVLDGGDGEFWLGLSVSDKGGSVSEDGGVVFVSLGICCVESVVIMLYSFGVSVIVDVEGMLWIN